MVTQTLTVSVNPVQESEYQQWLPYWKNYQAFYKINLSEDITQTTWQRFLDEQEPVYCAVAKEGDKILGFVHYLYHRSTWAKNNFCYLEDLYVSPEARGKHVGKQLIEYVKQQAKMQQCARLYWHTQEINITAQKLYDWIAEKPGVIEYRMSL
ncbi:MAG: family N-acetyltransferase [Gammaproteobacteria bacterium]|jgi:GNAT superfamily N-acetyltransferase|nr:family N-acetyltransferase [Gammaproteobacteria bacterium]